MIIRNGQVVLLRFPHLEGVIDAHWSQDVTCSVLADDSLCIRVGERQFRAEVDASCIDEAHGLTRLAVVKLERRRCPKRRRSVPSILPLPAVPRPEGDEDQVVVVEALTPMVWNMIPMTVTPS